MKAGCILIITRCNVSVLVLLSCISVNIHNCNSVLCSGRIENFHYISLSEFLCMEKWESESWAGRGDADRTESNSESASKEPSRQSRGAVAQPLGTSCCESPSRAARGGTLT